MMNIAEVAQHHMKYSQKGVIARLFFSSCQWLNKHRMEYLSAFFRFSLFMLIHHWYWERDGATGVQNWNGCYLAVRYFGVLGGQYYDEIPWGEGWLIIEKVRIFKW